MKKNLNQDDFESFLQQAADGHKMYPTDRVWQAIDKKMEHQRKWPALRFASALLVTIVMGVLFYAQPDKNELHNFNSSKKQVSTRNNSATAAKPQFGTQPPSVIVAQSKKSAVAEYIASSDDAAVSPIVTSRDVANPFSAFPRAGSMHLQQASASEGLAIAGEIESAQLNFKSNLFTRYNESFEISETAPAVESRLFAKESFWNASPAAVIQKAKAAYAWRTQFYVTPSVSSRFIKETGLGAVPLAFSSGTQSKLKNLVTFKPSIGIEAGVAFVKPLTSNFNVRVGVQANYRSYEIDGWLATPSVASITVRNSSNNYNSVTSLSNIPGTSETSLRNSYVQLATPIGIDFAVARSKKVSVIIGASIQPTYTVAQKAYILSSDYKHYMEQPDLMRKFAVNNSAELGLRVQGKKLQYQVGPQIRYQLTPTTKQEYSIKENLIDYGFKIGISKTN